MDEPYQKRGTLVLVARIVSVFSAGTTDPDDAINACLGVASSVAQLEHGDSPVSRAAFLERAALIYDLGTREG